MSHYYSQSPPPLMHPVPTHPVSLPEPPGTPGSPQGYQRFTSSPPSQNAPLPHQHQQSYSQNLAQAYPFQPQQQPPLQQQRPMGQMGQGGPGGPLGTPDFAAWGMDGPTAQFGMQLGQSAVAAGQDYVQKNFGGFIPYTTLKHHFNVSNLYVVQKLRLILFPWRHKPWTRRIRRADQGYSQVQGAASAQAVQSPAGEWLPPREDINSPDLYIPSMALVTYILLAALNSGLSARFNPTIFGASASRALGVVLIDFLFVKLGCYFLGVQQGPTGGAADLVAYGGYKFVGVIVTLFAGMLNVGTTIYGIIFLYAFFANAFFLLRSLRSVVLPDPVNSPANVGTVNPSQRKKRITFLFLEAVSQILYMGVLVRV